MHPSGYREVRVFSIKDLEGLDPAESAVRIGAAVGNKKRREIQEQALSAGLKILNPREIGSPATEVSDDD